MAEGSREGAAILENSWPGGVVFGLPGGHRSRKSKERAALSSMSLVLCVHCVSRKQKGEVKQLGKIHIGLIRMTDR